MTDVTSFLLHGKSWKHLAVRKQMINRKIEIFVFDRNAWNHLILFKRWTQAHLEMYPQNEFKLGEKKSKEWVIYKLISNWKPFKLQTPVSSSFIEYPIHKALCCIVHCVVILFTQPLRSGRIWHKVNF